MNELIQDITLHHVINGRAAVPEQTLWTYSAADPYAIHVILRGDVHWDIARELLTDGLDKRAGLGDVQVWPWVSPRGEFLALALSSPDGRALFEVPRSTVVRFLRRTYLAVPRGQERVDIDAVIRRLCEGSTA